MLIYLAGWLLFGGARSESVARDFFARQWTEVVSADVTSVGPSIPPLWMVFIDGEVIVHGQGGAGRISGATVLLIEPLTGFVLVFGRG